MHIETMIRPRDLASCVFGMGVGNTTEALVATFCLNRFIQFEPSLSRVRDVVGIVFFAALLSTFCSATIGVVSGYMGGVIAPDHVALAWRAWWVGDMMSDLILAPLLFTLSVRPLKFEKESKSGETVMLVACTAIVSAIVFLYPSEGLFRLRPYLMFPLICWAALRFHPRAVCIAIAYISVMSVHSVASGFEPFTRQGVSEGLIAVQVFVGVLSLTGLLLAAEVSRRRSSEAALALSEISLRSMVREKETLLKEIHHRVKNNLQIISSLISLQASSTPDEGLNEFYRVTRRRVRSMALIHEQLYKSSDLFRLSTWLSMRVHLPMKCRPLTNPVRIKLVYL